MYKSRWIGIWVTQSSLVHCCTSIELQWSTHMQGWSGQMLSWPVWIGLAGNVGDMSCVVSCVVSFSLHHRDIAMSPRHFLWWHVTLVMSHHIHSYLFIYRVSVLWHSFCHNVNMWQSHVADMSCVATSCVSENALGDISCRRHSQLSSVNFTEAVIQLKWLKSVM